MKKKNNYFSKYNKIAWIFLAAFLILWAYFIVGPFVNSIPMSFQTCKGSVCEFSGLDNINKMINDKVFIEAFKNTMIFLIVQVPIMLFLGLIYAALLNNPKLKFFRIISYNFIPTSSNIISCIFNRI